MEIVGVHRQDLIQTFLGSMHLAHGRRFVQVQVNPQIPCHGDPEERFHIFRIHGLQTVRYRLGGDVSYSERPQPVSPCPYVEIRGALGIFFFHEEHGVPGKSHTQGGQQPPVFGGVFQKPLQQFEFGRERLFRNSRSHSSKKVSGHIRHKVGHGRQGHFHAAIGKKRHEKEEKKDSDFSFHAEPC